MDLKINGAIKSAEELVKSLNEATEDVTLVINSPGGSVLEGLQVVNAIRNCKQKVTAKVEVMACSMGGVIALACNQLIMHKDDLLMLHNCMSYAEGNKEEMANVIESMKAIDAVLHSIVMEHAKDKTLDARIDNGEVFSKLPMRQLTEKFLRRCRLNWIRIKEDQVQEMQKQSMHCPDLYTVGSVDLLWSHTRRKTAVV